MPEIIDADWNRVWRENNIPAWDYLSQAVFSVLRNEIGDFQGKNILEAGSGSGRISLKLSKDKAKAYLLDNSPEAIAISKKIFKDADMKSGIVCASLFQMPYLDNSFDIVWNSGVIEHFVGEERNAALREMLRVCKLGGFVITLNPYAGSLLHTFGKFIIEGLAEYPFSDEIPIHSLEENIRLLNCDLVKEEYSVGFFVLWVGMFKRLMLLPKGYIFNPIFSALNKLFCFLDESLIGALLRNVDLALSEAFGGYLLVSMFKKKG